MKKGLLVLLAVALTALPVLGMSAPGAQVSEVLYLSDSGSNTVGTYLYSVSLNPTSGQADLTLLPSGLIPFNQVDALACDGGNLYAIDKYGDSAHPGTGHLGIYDIATAAFTDVGPVTYGGTIIRGIVLAACDTGGTLYAASENTDSLYTVNKGTGVASLVGQIVLQSNPSVIVNVSGADIVFGADGTLYLWSNNARGAAPRGLYTLTIGSGIVYAQHLGAGGTGSYFTGLAIREDGRGDLVGSTHEDEIFIVSKIDGSTIGSPLMMYLGGTRYNYEYGDMTAGRLVLCTRTIGYWKNHSWPGSVTINGETITELIGRGPAGVKPGTGILWQARGNNFSMLYAQLIAAKLNGGGPEAAAAEAFLAGEGITLATFDAEFASKQQKKNATKLKDALDAFNNSIPCE